MIPLSLRNPNTMNRTTKIIYAQLLALWKELYLSKRSKLMNHIESLQGSTHMTSKTMIRQPLRKSQVRPRDRTEDNIRADHAMQAGPRQ
jgi:hypothetical protein